MTSVLKVQGVELDVSLAEWTPVRLGQLTRSQSGKPRSSVRAVKRDHHFLGDAGGVTVEVAEAIRALVEGEGHSWSFDDWSGDEETALRSSRGLLPTAFGSVVEDFGKYGSAVQFDGDTTLTEWSLGYDDAAATLMYWLKEGGTTWAHFLVRYTGAGTEVWRNTTQQFSDPQAFYLGSNGILYGDPTSIEGGFIADELAVLPFAVPQEWVTGLYTLRAAQAWYPLPYVAAEGAVFPRGVAKVRGQADVARGVPLRDGGTFTLGQTVDFILMES